MSLDERHLKHLEERLRCAKAVTRELFSEAIEQAFPRVLALAPEGKADVVRLITAGAWTDAVLALLALELPLWKLRRAINEDGQWLCSLSRQPTLPFDLDDPIETCHETLPVAILLALVAARQATAASTVVASSVPKVRLVVERAVCCDNFS